MKAPTEAQISNRLSQIADSLPAYADREFSDTVLSDFCNLAIQVSMPKSAKMNHAQIVALKNSVFHMYKKYHTLQIVKSNMHRLLANWHFIREGMSIPEWKGECIEGTALFIGVKRLPIGPGERPKYHVMLKLKTGIAAGIITCALLTESNIYRFMDKCSGTREFNCAPEEIAGMQADLRFEASNGMIRIRQWSCTQGEKKKNKDLALIRSDIRKCKKNIPCNACRCTIHECNLAVWLPAERS